MGCSWSCQNSSHIYHVWFQQGLGQNILLRKTYISDLDTVLAFLFDNFFPLCDRFWVKKICFIQWSFLAVFWGLTDSWLTFWKPLMWILVTFIAAIYFYSVLGDSASFRSQRSQPNWFLNVCVSIELLYLTHCVWGNLNATQLILACLMVAIKKKVHFNSCWQYQRSADKLKDSLSSWLWASVFLWGLKTQRRIWGRSVECIHPRQNVVTGLKWSGREK